MKNEPLISIVTPMYNAEKLIGETIESVLNQTYQNWEWIVVDNCSTDKSRDLITAINDSRIKVISLEKNSGGPAHPRNVGIENAKGEYVALLDADDIWHNEKLEALSKYYGEYEIIYHNEIHFYNKVEEGFKVNSVDVDKLKDLYSSLLIHGNIFSPSATMIKREILSIFNFDEYIGIQGVEDYDLWIRLAEKSYLYKFDNRYLGYYRLHDEAYSRNFKVQGQRERYLLKKYFVKYSLLNSPKMFLYKYKRLLKSIVSNVKWTIKMKKPLDVKFYINELLKVF